MTHKGFFSLPFSMDGQSSLVARPPWYFGGECMEIIYKTDPVLLSDFLPYPFKPVHNKPYVCVEMSEMISVSEENTAFLDPENTQYKECLFKLYCTLNGTDTWYAPVSWVTADFSLVRGYYLGFGKKFGAIYISRFHELNPAVGVKRKGARMRGVCKASNNLYINVDLKLTARTEKVMFSGLSLRGMRYFPDAENPDKPLFHDVVELVAEQYRRSQIWNATGTISMQKTDREPITFLQPEQIITARTFREGFKLAGVRSIYRHNYA